MKRICCLQLLMMFMLLHVVNAQDEQRQTIHKDSSKIEFLPIVSYDADAGVGYGGKAFFLNHLSSYESLDLTIFNSTKGERWYRLVFSIPDFELRQGKQYDLAIDFIFDYDKMIKNSFFGIGRCSKYEGREFYVKEPIDISIILGRGFTTRFVAQTGIRLKIINSYGFEETGRLRTFYSANNSTNVKYVSALASLRYDSRNSFINPSAGVVAQTEIEQTLSTNFGNAGFTKVAAVFQLYSKMFMPEMVLAFRAGLHGLIGNNIPPQAMLSLGGNNTLRGFPQDRFLDKVVGMTNVEIRFPIYGRLGGITGIDAGNVWSAFGKIGIKDWAVNKTFGLRFLMDTFIVRLDVGLSSETTGFYFNFNHIF